MVEGEKIVMEFVFLSEVFDNGVFKKEFDKAPVEKGLEQLAHKELLEMGEIKYGSNFLGLRTI